MNLPPIKSSFVKTITLDALFAEALSFGRVSLCTSEGGKFWATIRFDTQANARLEADSPFKDTPHEALMIAIGMAKKIKDQFK